jgi:hypothetical protein
MDLEPRSNSTTDAPPKATTPSIFETAAASIEQAAAARNAASEAQNASRDRSASQPPGQKTMHHAEPVDTESVLPVPAGPLRKPVQDNRRTSLWTRIKMKARPPQEGPARAEVSARLKSIEHQIDDLEAAVGEQFHSLTSRLDEVWECEEQLSHLVDIQDKVGRFSQSQGELNDAVRELTRKVFLLTGCVVVLAGLAAVGVLAQFQ